MRLSFPLDEWTSLVVLLLVFRPCSGHAVSILLVSMFMKYHVLKYFRHRCHLKALLTEQRHVVKQMQAAYRSQKSISAVWKMQDRRSVSHDHVLHVVPVTWENRAAVSWLVTNAEQQPPHVAMPTRLGLGLAFRWHPLANWVLGWHEVVWGQESSLFCRRVLTVC